MHLNEPPQSRQKLCASGGGGGKLGFDSCSIFQGKVRAPPVIDSKPPMVVATHLEGSGPSYDYHNAQVPVNSELLFINIAQSIL
jgi:hypothetical protein